MERDFISILADLDEGNVNAQLSDLLAEITRAVMTTSLAGTINLSLKISKQGGMAIITPKVSSKKPAPATDATMFYVDDDGHLSRNDTRQMELRHVAPVAPGELRAVPTITDHGLVTTSEKKGA